MAVFDAQQSPLSGILFGAAYYNEYQVDGTLDTDLDLMQEAGFSVIRVGESVWSTWEPRDGEFNLDWLQPVLDAAHARGIRAILGTPTYAVPPWLQRTHPEIAADKATGVPTPWGARQEMDYTHPTFQRYAERVIRAIIARYADHPAVIGFQVDNEPGAGLIHNPHVFQGFLEYLRERYGDVETLNSEWGLVYWSHRISEWSDLWRPDGNLMPQYQLEWRRYQSRIMNDFIHWQAGIVREYSRADQFVTTCISYERPPVADDALVGGLDITAGNPYYLMQEGLAAGVDVPRRARWWTTGAWALFQQADRMYSSAQDRFLVTETNAQSIGGHWQNQPPYPGQIAQAALTLVSRGARMIEYWHWHTLHFGVETYWGGILPHSQRPGRIYREIADLGKTLRMLGPALEGYVPDAEVGLLYSMDTKWSFDFFPPLALSDGVPDTDSYLRIFDSFYRGAFEAGLQANILHTSQFLDIDPAELARRLPVLVAPALYVADDRMLDLLREYAHAGGHLVVGIRTGYGDELARARREVAPARLAAASGVWYEEYNNLAADVPVVSGGGIALSEGAAATAWIDGLYLDGAEAVLSYEHREFGQFPALTTHEHGAGRISYLGTVANPALARDVFSWLLPEPRTASWGAPPEVSVVSGTNADGARVWFVHNWSPTRQEVTAPRAMDNLLLGQGVDAHATVFLDPWSVQVFIEV